MTMFIIKIFSQCLKWNLITSCGVVPVTKRHWVSRREWKYLEKLTSCSVLYPTIYEMKKVPNGMLPIKNGFRTCLKAPKRIFGKTSKFQQNLKQLMTQLEFDVCEPALGSWKWSKYESIPKMNLSLSFWVIV